jgi:hypothetical protein
MGKRTILVSSFAYTDPEGRSAWAQRGDTVELSESDIERGERLDAFVPKGRTIPEMETRARAAAAGVPSTPEGQAAQRTADASVSPAGAVSAPTPPSGSPATNNDPYDEMKVPDAVGFLEDLSEEDREQYFERERAAKRKGVLLHFDQPLWEGADA